MNSVYSVGQVSEYIRRMFDQDLLMTKVSVRGEISNCKYHSSGHIYFTLKDRDAQISCIMFAGNRRSLTFTLQNGQNVIVTGSISVYPKGGSYQLYARAVTPDGIGRLYEQYEALKRELEEMGMFDASYKVPIPKYIRTLGVVTAPTGAAVRDIINIAKRRNPGIRIILYPAQVQGEGAASSIAAGIRLLEQAGVDVMIIGRGGGSIEDLWAFNEEETARAVFACRVPVISAVGHETDTVITDLVADLRAPTPSAAAELAVADMSETALQIRSLETRLMQLMEAVIRERRAGLDNRKLKMALFSPINQINRLRQQLEEKRLSLEEGMNRAIADSRHRLELTTQKLEGLSPKERLRQGYALVETPEGVRVQTAIEAQKAGQIRLYFSDGSARAEVKQISLFEAEEETENDYE